MLLKFLAYFKKLANFKNRTGLTVRLRHMHFRSVLIVQASQGFLSQLFIDKLVL